VLIRVRRLHEELADCFEEARPLDDLTKILDYTNEMLIVVSGYRFHSVLAWMFVLEDLSRVEDFAKAYARHIGESTMRSLCDELKGLPEGGDVDG